MREEGTDMSLRHTLESMVAAGRKALILHNKMAENGYSNTPYFDLYSASADAIYSFIGEDSMTFESSVTYRALNDICLTDAQRVDLLVQEYSRHMLVVEPTTAVRLILKREAFKRNISLSRMANVAISDWAIKNDPACYDAI